ncbi:large ribosomal subunit protein bL9m [Pholidichthys leucotaenia]
MWNLRVLQAVRNFSRSPAQNTVVVERWWQVPLSKVGSPPRLYPRRHRVYKLVEDTLHSPKGKLELILTQTVPKLGGRGDTVFVKKSVGRNKLLPQGLAVYASPENKQMFAEELKLLRERRPEDRIQTRSGQMTVELLKRSKLKIHKMPPEDFQLNKEVVCRQFKKKLGIFLPTHALTLPFEPIKDVGDYWCEVMVNGIDRVRIPMSLVPYEDLSAKHQRQLKVERQQAAAEAASDAPVEDETDEESAAEDAAAVTTQKQTTAPPGSQKD